MKCKLKPAFCWDLSHWIARGLHGYCHEFVSTLSEQQQRDVMAKSVDNLTDFLGKKPRGWTAPAWDTSRQTIKIRSLASYVYFSGKVTRYKERKL